MKKSNVLFVIVLLTSIFNFYNVKTNGNQSGTNVIITEVMYDPLGTDANREWIELFNPTTNDISIENWYLSHDLITLTLSGLIPANSFAILTESISEFSSEYGFTSGLIEIDSAINLGNSGDGLTLQDGITTIDYVAWEDYTATWSIEGLSASIQRIDLIDTNTAGDWEVGTTTGSPGVGYGENSLVFYTPHDTIVINGNANFTTSGLFTGSGIQGDPYLFKDAFINSNGEPGINISNTDVYFRIENVWVNGTSSADTGAFNLFNVSYGIIKDITSTYSSRGIKLDNSSYNSIENSYFSNNVRGIQIKYSNVTTISTNVVTDSSAHSIYVVSSNNSSLIANFINNNNKGINLITSRNNSVKANYVNSSNSAGIIIRNSANYNLIEENILENNNQGINIDDFSSWNNIKNNTAKNNRNNGFRSVNTVNNSFINNYAINNNENGFYLDNSNFSLLITNFVSGNQLSGFNITDSYSLQVTDNVISSNSMSGIVLLNTNQSLISYNEILNHTSPSGMGIFLQFSYNNSITNNSIYNSLAVGVYLYGTDYNVISRNYVSNVNFNWGGAYALEGALSCSFNTFKDNFGSVSAVGLTISGSCNNNTIINNIFVKNLLEGIKMDAGDNNSLNQNIILENGNPSTDSGINNVWNFNVYDSYCCNFGGYHIISPNGEDFNAQLGDFDSDGIVDWYEIQYNLNLTENDSQADFDNDGLTNLEEFFFGSASNSSDTDSDGMPDSFEYVYNLNTTLNDALLDLDNDTFINFQEYLLGTDPTNSNSNGTVFIVEISTITELSTIVETSTETTTEITNEGTITVPDSTTKTETRTEIETTITTVISQIIENVTKTAEGFSIVLAILGIFFIFLRRRKNI